MGGRSYNRYGWIKGEREVSEELQRERRGVGRTNLNEVVAAGWAGSYKRFCLSQ